MTEEELKEFDEASNHPYECTCDICKKWWELMGEGEEDYSDAYYGIRHWGWDEGVEISEGDAAVLLRLGIAEDWRTYD